MGSRIAIRWMTRLDLPDVAKIELACYGETWGVEFLKKLIQGKSAVPFVAMRGNAAIGFLIAESDRLRMLLLNMMVLPDWQLKGVGTAMLGALKWRVETNHENNRIVADVRDGNIGAQKFLRAEGFRAVRVLRDWCEDTDQDTGEPIKRDAYRFVWWGHEQEPKEKT